MQAVNNIMNIEELIFVAIPIAIIKKFGYFKKNCRRYEHMRGWCYYDRED